MKDTFFPILKEKQSFFTIKYDFQKRKDLPDGKSTFISFLPSHF
ncbi:hypothetical protein CHCC20335_0493 [Bacillus paralicheniformis]|nr:hypothetical protein CHCC20335_0493 [Bacillus paralicheniformis]